MNVAEFLRRIAYTGPTTPVEENLRALHRAFTTTIPFENLDIFLGRRIVLDQGAVYEKVVNQRRGGFCFELNGLFAAALQQLGFDVTLLSARVFAANGEWGRDFVHLALLVTLETRWIADVGFGDWSAEPLNLDSDGVQIVDGNSYRIRPNASRYVVEKLTLPDHHWRPRYSFGLEPRQLAEFTEMCDDLQTVADSAFRRGRICTRGIEGGRITLTEENLIITQGTNRNVIIVQDKDAYDSALKKHFGICLPLQQL